MSEIYSNKSRYHIKSVSRIDVISSVERITVCLLSLIIKNLNSDLSHKIIINFLELIEGTEICKTAAVRT